MTRVGPRALLLAALAALQAGDVISTNLIPHLEANPVVLWLMAWLGAWWWLAKLPALLPVLLLATKSNGGLAPLATLTGLYALIVANNFFNIATTL